MSEETKNKSALKSILAFISVLVAIGCFALIGFIAKGVQAAVSPFSTEAAPAEAAGLMAESLPTATMILPLDTPMPPPTADYPRLTAEAGIIRETDTARSIDATIAWSVVVSATAQQDAINANNTSVAYTQTSVIQTQTAQPPASTATAQWQATHSAELGLYATQTIEAPTQMWAAARAERADEIIDAQTFRDFGVGFFLVGIVALAGMKLFRDWGSGPQQQAQEDEPDEDDPTPTGYQRPFVIQTTNTDNGAIVVNVDDWTGICTSAQLLAVARGVILDKMTLSFRNWYGKDGGKDEKDQDRPFTRVQYETFLKALVDGVGPEKKKLAMKLNNGVVILNDYGRKYLAEVLKVVEDHSPTANELAA